MYALLNLIKTADLSDPEVMLAMAQMLRSVVAGQSFYLHECVKPTCSPESYAMSRQYVDAEWQQVKELVDVLYKRFDKVEPQTNVWD